MHDPAAVRVPAGPRWPSIDAAFAVEGGAVPLFDAVMAALGAELDADRCFLYLRDGGAGVGAVVSCWSQHGRWPDLRSDPAPERDGFGHRALIDAPVVAGGRLAGILEPCVFGAPRSWSATDQVLVAAVQARPGPIAGAAIEAGLLRGPRRA